jgi:hypothetical protein
LSRRGKKKRVGHDRAGTTKRFSLSRPRIRRRVKGGGGGVQIAECGGVRGGGGMAHLVEIRAADNLRIIIIFVLLLVLGGKRKRRGRMRPIESFIAQ